ncbi:hypothetical protein IC582_022399 [Cucumis melo]|uniref:Uncharacterized protein LOC103482776 isoform X1 n=2 Tax=Cucumis melo TaxID=3656 RepID=A0A9I9CM68_CUCME|nr:uncharacterized protein LOC103482776 isoform X1 [Cucumis melo]KAA0042731.1 hypothetical protein E6C27_scaffold44G002300 [Cucumis melo var. makuwa]
MRGAAALLTVKNKPKLIHPTKGSWGSLTSTVQRQGMKNDSEGESVVTKEKADPIAAFSKPPPLPPLLGPLAVLSLLETYLSPDGNDD